MLQEAGRSPSSFDRDIAGTLEAAVVDAGTLQALTAERLPDALAPGLEAFAATPVADGRGAPRTPGAGRGQAAQGDRTGGSCRAGWPSPRAARSTEAERLRERAAEALDAARKAAELDGG